MRAGTGWTTALDERLRSLREAGGTWDGVALAMGLGRNTVLERARKIGARAGRMAAPRIIPEPLDRPARPAGHPDSWCLINRGTVLENSAYPFPVFI